MTYSYDRTAALGEKTFTDGFGNPTGPSTPWGRADHVKEIARGVRWVTTPGHGGLGVARGAADKLLSSAARRLGNYQGGYFWYEEDVQCNIPFYEHPEWARLAGFSGTVNKEHFESGIRRSYPKYFEYLNDGVKDAPRLKPGMKLKAIGPLNFRLLDGSSYPLIEGATVEVVRVTSSSFVFVAENQKFKVPLGYYYGHGYDSSKYFEAV
jgi:hypothetical protein